MNKKVLTIISTVVIVILIICSIIGLVIWNSSGAHLEDFEDILENGSAITPTPTDETNTIAPIVACNFLTTEDAVEILGTTVKADIADGSNACTYYVDTDDLTDSRRIALVIMATGSQENARQDFEISKSFFDKADIEDINLNKADAAFYSQSTNQLYVQKDNNYFIVVAIASEFDSHLDTAKLAAEKVLNRL